MSGARLGVVVNPAAGSGRGRTRGDRVVAALRRRGHAVHDLTSASVEEASGRARRAAVQGLDALVVVGGDGMVHLGVNVVAGTDLPLGIVAAGSGNDAARTLGLPRHDVDGAIRAIEDGLESGGRTIDAVVAGPPDFSAREWFVCVLSAGFDAAVNARANRLRWPRGRSRYVRALAADLGGFRPYGYRVTVDDVVWESAGTLVAVANGPSIGGGMRIAPDARVDDGLLDVVVAGPLTRTGLVAIFPEVYSGSHVRHPACQVLRGRSVLVEPSVLGAPPPYAFADGEPVGALPLRVEVQPGALRVLAPGA